jgi:putative ABC transport system permease protein
MLTILSLVAAVGLMAIALLLSAGQKLGLEQNIAVATGRMVLQLLVFGYVLEAVVEVRSALVTGVAIAVFWFTTTLLTRNRISQTLPGLLPIVGGAMAVSLILCCLYAYLLIFQTESGFAILSNSLYWLALVGLLLGGVMNGVAIAGERFVSALNAGRGEIETQLGLGATPAQATMGYRREAIRAGLLPLLNSMTVMGLVTMPGFMGGQIFSGWNPLQAAFYQIVLICLMAIASLIAMLLLLSGILKRSFNPAAQLVLS